MWEENHQHYLATDMDFSLTLCQKKFGNVPRRYEHKNFSFMFDVTLILILNSFGGWVFSYVSAMELFICLKYHF